MGKAIYMTPELQKQIEQEAKEYAQKRCDDFEGKKHLHRKTLLMYAHQSGATGYAEKWQAAEARAERMEKALREIKFKATSAIFPHLPVETVAAQVCIEIEQLATETLTPKTGTDE